MASTVWSGRLSFGLVSIPVRLTPAARAKKIPLRRVARTPSRTESFEQESAEPSDDEPALPAAAGPGNSSRQEPASEPQPVRAAVIEGEQARVHYAPMRGEERVAPVEVEHAFEFEKNRFVPLDKTALAQLAAPTSTEMEVSEFVKLEQIDPVYFETSYFVIPGPGGEKPYALFFRALRDAGLVAVASLAMHRREHTVILRPGHSGLLLHTMFYADEVRSEQEYAASEDVNPKELAMAGMLIEAMTGDFDAAKFKDPYREKLQAMIDARIPAAAAAAEAPARAAAPVVDIMEALQASLAKLKKPAAAAERAAPQKKPKRLTHRAG